MKKTKKIIIVCIVIALLIALIFFLRSYISKNKVVGVDRVEMYANTWSSTDESGYGQIIDGGSQEIILSATSLIDKVYVKQGDKVKKDDPIIKYDTTQNKINIESKRIQYEMSKNNLNKAIEKLAYYKTFKPYVEPEIVHINTIPFVEDSGDAVSGTGTLEDPYVFNLDYSSKISGAYLQTLYNTFFVRFDIYYSMPGYSSVKIATLNIKNEEGTLSTASELSISEYINVNEVSGLVTLTGKTLKYCEFNQLANDIYVPEKEIPYEESLTEKEIKELIQSQEQMISELNIAVAQAKLDYQRASSTSEDGIIKATNDGVVTFVSDNKYDYSSPYIIISSSDKYTIQTTINEYRLANYSIGDTFEITMWSNGMTYTATITSISNFPTQDNYSYSYGNSASNYEVHAELDCQDELRSWDGGEIKFPSSASKALFSLESCFVRKEDGKYYVLVENENNRIEKRYVEIGRLINSGYYTEIIDGLNLDDYIAFPYGSDAVVGAKADHNKEVYSW